MNWRLKSIIQRGCSALPWGSETIYYGLQRTCGTLRRPSHPTEMLREAVSLVSWLRDAGLDIREARIFEVGTGRRLDMPLGFYLAGGGPLFTFDLHRYLKSDLVRQSVDFMSGHRELMESIFVPTVSAELFTSRLQALSQAGTQEELLKVAAIEYHAPTDAAHTDLPPGSIDLHTSYTVFEHIPHGVLKDILMEARRVLSPRGVVLHHIDPSDHFSHDDGGISAINFLQFSDRAWDRYANNQFAYHNRLRCSEYRELFEACGFEILRWQEWIDEPSVEQLKSGFPLDARFQDMSPRTLCCRVVRVLARPRPTL